MVTHRQRYREKVSQMVSWGHWFALFNILLAMVLGSRYLFVADWPTTLAGRIYSYLSIVGHFSFLVFAAYLLILFPLTFIVMSQRLMRFLSAILATAGMTLLLIDSQPQQDAVCGGAVIHRGGISHGGGKLLRPGESV